MISPARSAHGGCGCTRPRGLAVLRWLLVSALAPLTVGCGHSPVPSGDQWQFRLPVAVHAGGVDRQYRAVEIPLAEAEWFADRSFTPTTFRVVEVDAGGRRVGDPVPFQVDPPDEPGGARVLVLLLRGETPGDATRSFQIYMGEGPGETSRAAADVNVRVTDDAPWYGQPSVHVSTPWGTWVYHKEGGGFASLIDREGRDWISFRPEGGSAGDARGLPNLVHPDGHFHPGSRTASTTVISAGPVRVQLRSETADGAWACTWSIYGTHATMTLQRAAGPYWFLYAGTPGGVLDESADLVVRSTGERTPASAHWQARLPAPRWVYVAAGNAPRSLFVVHHEDDGDGDQYWPMEGNMTVLGFGREYPCCGKSLRAVPARFSVGLVESRDAATVTRAIDSAHRELRVDVGRLEPRREW
jgi:hypothetical protein